MNNDTNPGLLMQAMGCYAALAQFRKERTRNKRYNYGDQWGDVIDVGGTRMTEEQFITSQGSVPLKNNLIRRLVRNVIGVYSSQAQEPVCKARDSDEKALGETMSTLLKCNGELNRLSTLYARSLEEFLISGLVVHRKWYGTRNGRTDCWTDYVQPNNFFVDADMRDFRGWDCRCIGEIHDVAFDTLALQLAKSADDYSRLQNIYAAARDAASVENAFAQFGAPSPACMSFLMPRNPAMCRVIEIWRKETAPYYRCHDLSTGQIFKMSAADYAALPDKKHIKAHWRMEERWSYHFLSPMGDVLASGISPYRHGMHPYVMKAYPLIDGEIHAFVGDVIDQQRHTNRLITMYDWIIRGSAKGLLLIPEDCIPVDATVADFAESWSRFNGVLVYKPSPQGNVPKQVSSNSTNIGISELLNLQLQFFEDISGVHGALQGKAGNAGMSAEMYGQQTHNATATLLDILNTFHEFVRDAAYVDVKNMQQFYDAERIRSIAGKDACDAQSVIDAEYDLSITPSLTSPATRNASNQLLMEIWKSGQITLKQLLAAGDFPFASKLQL